MVGRMARKLATMTKVKLILADNTDQSDAASTTASNYTVWNRPEAVSKISCSFKRVLLSVHAHPTDHLNSFDPRRFVAVAVGPVGRD